MRTWRKRPWLQGLTIIRSGQWEVLHFQSAKRDQLPSFTSIRRDGMELHYAEAKT